MNTNPTIRPTPPNAPAKMMRGNRNIRIVEDIFTVGVVKEASADNATAINKMVLVKAASTDACPITIPPTIPIVWPTLVGKRAPASRSNSIVISKKVPLKQVEMVHWLGNK